jgi:ribosome biogenesis GTPase
MIFLSEVHDFYQERFVRGIVIRGTRNVFAVRGEDGGELECRIKGKVLKGVDAYNPLAPGDWVEYQNRADDEKQGLILRLEERKNSFTRFNQEGGSVQILAANVDLVLCVTSPASPPFRPRFLDRLVLQADIAGIEPVIVCNKMDLADTGPALDERLGSFSGTGCKVLKVSAFNGYGIAGLRSLILGKITALAGQSGVGKSSLINALAPSLNIKTGPLNEKYDRGNHTTRQARLIRISADENGGEEDKAVSGRFSKNAAGLERCGYIIDTPGVRRFVPNGISADELILYMREFAPFAGKCAYGLSCSHRSENGCKIREAVAAGDILEDRYESFLRISDELQGRSYE